MKNFFYFTSLHKIAILVLTLIILTISVATHFLDSDLKTDYDFTEFQEEINALKKTNKPNVKNVPTQKNIFKKHTYTKSKLLKIEINSADTLAFQKLPQIGPFYAKKICKYRQLLGGFYSIKQLNEVYGIDSNRYALIESHVFVDTTLVVRRNINNLDEKELKKHPYISSNLARVINNYVLQHGNFKTIDDLYKIHLIDSHKFRKIVPYFTTNVSH